jgi:mannonate dehydratase
MYVGTQFKARHETDIRQLAQLGIEHVDVTPSEHWTEWTVDLLTSIREQYAKYGITVETMHSPPSSRVAFESGMPHLFLGPSDERERELDGYCELIRMASEAGLRGLLYNVTVLGNLRTASRPGRGGATLSAFKYADLDQSLPEFEGGAADADTMWERIDHFLARVVPVANEYKVQLACHPQDPGIKDYEYRGVARVMGTVDGIKRFVSMHESPYHGLNFCQGTISEMLERPGDEIYDVIRYFGSRNKIFNVHFRNIKGGVLDFVEVFPDEGDVDMLRAVRTYREVGYPYMLMPDHVPDIDGDEAQQVGFAYCYGYIHAMIQAANDASMN